LGKSGLAYSFMAQVVSEKRSQSQCEVVTFMFVLFLTAFLGPISSAEFHWKKLLFPYFPGKSDFSKILQNLVENLNALATTKK
jgi:hypothetical protein